MVEEEKFVFISHSNNAPADVAIAENLYKFFTGKKICAWMDRQSMRSGKWQEQINERIIRAAAYVLIASDTSCRSSEVQSEVVNIHKQVESDPKRAFVPLFIDADFMGKNDVAYGSIGYYQVTSYQGVQLSKWATEEQAFEDLLKYLPLDLTKLDNNPNDFVFSEDDRTLIRYKGNDATVFVPPFVSRIEKNAFLYNKTLQRVIIPDSVQSIGLRAFLGCSELHCVEGMSCVGEVDPSAFSSTQAIEVVDGFSCLNGIVLGGDESRKELILPEVRVIADSAFECCDAKTLLLPSSLEVIGKRAFADSCFLTEVKIPASVKKIGKKAFSGCIRLGKVIFEGKRPENAEEIFDKNVTITEE